MDSQVQAAWISLAGQIVGGILAVLAAAIAWKTRREQKRLREGFLMLADERRTELWADMQKSGLTALVSKALRTWQAGQLEIFATIPKKVRDLAARKYRIDQYRDEEWKAAGKPRGRAVRRPF